MILIRFGLEWEALVAPDQQPHQQAANCRRIVAFWEAHGVLVLLGGDDGRRRFLDALERMPQGTRKLWKEAIKKLKLRFLESSQPDVVELLEGADLQCLVGHVDLVGVDDARCGLLGVGEEDVSASPGSHQIEVARIHAVDQAVCVVAARETAGAEIRRGQSPELIWNARVAELLRYSKDVVLVDRYSGADVARCAGVVISGLEFMLRQIWTLDVTVTVLMADPRPVRDEDHESAMSDFRQAPLVMVNSLVEEIGPRTRALAFHRLPDRDFADLSHDRYLRCDSWLLKLDTGIELFSAGSMQRARTLFEMSVCSIALLMEKQKTEKRLRVRATGSMRLEAGAACVANDAVG